METNMIFKIGFVILIFGVVSFSTVNDVKETMVNNYNYTKIKGNNIILSPYQAIIFKLN